MIFGCVTHTRLEESRSELGLRRNKLWQLSGRREHQLERDQFEASAIIQARMVNLSSVWPISSYGLVVPSCGLVTVWPCEERSELEGHI